MKLMKKNLALVLSIVALAGCGRTSDTGTTAKTSEEDSGTVTVTWWNNYQDPTQDNVAEETARKSSTYREYYYAKDLIEQFEAANKGVKIQMVYHGSYSDIYTDVKAAIEGSNLPTIASTYQDNVAFYVNEGVSYDMTNYGTQLESDKDFNQNYLSIEKQIFNGKYYSLPYSKSSETFVVNQTVFDQEGAGLSGTTTTKETTKTDGTKETVNVYTAPEAAATKTKYTVPQNFYEMIEIARKMKADYPEVFNNQRDAKGYFTAVPFCWDSAENMFISLLKNADIDYTDGSATGIANQNKWNCAEAKKLMIQLKKWNNEGLICTQNQLPIANETKGYHEYSSNMVVAGKIFMCVSSTAGARYFATNGGFEASLNHALNWAENSKASDAKVISQGPSLTFFKDRNAKVNEAAFKFYQFLTNTDNSANLAVNTSYFPLRETSYNSEKVKAITTAAGTATAESTYADKSSSYTGEALNLNKTYSSEDAYFMSDAFVGSAEIRSAVGGIVADVFNGKAESDTEIETLVNTAFNNAYTKIAA